MTMQLAARERPDLRVRVLRAIGSNDPLTVEDTITYLRRGLLGELYGPEFEAMGDHAFNLAARKACLDALDGRTRKEKREDMWR